MLKRFVVHEEFDSQPLGNRIERNRNRQYVAADWEEEGENPGHPKIDGGETLSRNNHTVIQTRAFNRPAQRYQQPVSEIIANRKARAEAEFNACVVLIGRQGHYEIRSPTGNNYDVTLSPRNCDCPDKLRLRLSYEVRDLDCKHILIVEMAVARAFPGSLDYSVGRVGEITGLEDRTVQDYCKKGIIAATKKHNVWMINPTDAQTFRSDYIPRIIFPGSIYDDGTGE